MSSQMSDEEEVFEVEYEEYYEGDYSTSSSSSSSLRNVFAPTERTKLSLIVNKFLLLWPLVTSLVFRSIASAEFRAISIAWAVILGLLPEISMDEGVIPALVSAAMGCSNNIVAQNMYISIARSRLGLFALFVLSYYSSNYQIFFCGALLKAFVFCLGLLLQGSVPKSELTLISGALVNLIFSLKSTATFGDVYNYQAVLVLGLLAAVPCYPLLLRFTRVYKNSYGSAKQPKLAWAIYIVFLSTGIYLYFFVYGVELESFKSVLSENSDLLRYWFTCLAVAISLAYFFGDAWGLDGRRKVWHLTTVFMFLPKRVRERRFTSTALAVALILLIALEVARATALPPFGLTLHEWLRKFVDHRDNQGPVIISHIYLLLGVATPIFLTGSSAGVLCLGLGDTFASQIGRRFGNHRIFGHKSIEGCVAFALAAGIAAYFSENDVKTLWTVVPTAIIEAVTPLNDNLVVPMYMLALQGLFKYR